MSASITAIAVLLFWSLVSGYSVDDCPADVRDKYTQVYGEKCYRFVVYRQADYHTAKSYCVKRGGSLASVKSREVNNFISDRLRNGYKLRGQAWIGLNDLEDEGRFQWEDGTPLVYSNFDPGEGTRRGLFSVTHWVQDCVAIDTISRGKWKDYRCSDLAIGFLVKALSFVCEFSVIKTPATTSASKTQTVTNSGAQNTTEVSSKTMTTVPTGRNATVTENPLEKNNHTDSSHGGTNATKTSFTNGTTQTKVEKTQTSGCPDLHCNLDCGMDGFKVNEDTKCVICACDT